MFDLLGGDEDHDPETTVQRSSAAAVEASRKEKADARATEAREKAGIAKTAEQPKQTQQQARCMCALKMPVDIGPRRSEASTPKRASRKCSWTT